MSDDRAKVGSPDRAKINQHEPYEMETAEKEMHVAAATIRGAIAEVGVSREKVERVVRKRKEGTKK